MEINNAPDSNLNMNKENLISKDETKKKSSSNIKKNK